MNLQVKTFASLVYPSHASRIALCLIPPNHRGSPEHRFTTVDGLGRFLSYAAYRNANGWGVYVTPSVLKPIARTRRKESFQDKQCVIYLDCDQAGCLDQIKRRYPYPTLVVRTSRRKYQVYWRLDRPVSVTKQEQLMSAIAVDVNADRAATDVSRVLRLPSFWNRKPGRNNSVDIVFTRQHTVAYTSLSEKLPISPRNGSSAKTITTGQRAAPAVLEDAKGTSDPSTTGRSQSEIDWYEVHRRLSRGDHPQDIIIWLETSRIDKPKPSYYAERTVRKALAQRAQNSRTRPD